MRLVRFGHKIINMDLVTNIRFNSAPGDVDLWLAASDSEGQPVVTLSGADVIALEMWLVDNCENARAPMEDNPDVS